MSVVWHLVKKDFHRLRLPLAVFSLLVLGKIIFYAVISGLFVAPDIEWLRRMQEVPVMLLRTLGEPVFAYVLAGWLVFEDSPVEQDAHWITRPISGAQLYGAKLLGAGLWFVLWPLALNLAWWVACGVSTADILLSAGELIGFHAVLVALGLGCAVLTGGFPRYILWSLVGTVVFAIAQLGFTLLPGGTASSLARLVAFGLSAGATALAIAAHQYVTRRHRRSLVFAAGAVLLAASIGVAAGFLPGVAPVPGARPLGPALPDTAGITLELTDPAQYWRQGSLHFAEVSLRIGRVPDKAAIAWLTVTGDWSFAGTKVWTSRAQFNRPSLWQEATRRQLGLPAPPHPDGHVTASVPFSRPLAERAVSEPAALALRADIELARGEILVELPLAGGGSVHDRGAYTLSHLFNGPLQQNRRRGNAAGNPGPEKNAVSVVLTERSAKGLKANVSGRMGATHFALVNRRTGEFFLPDGTRGGPEAVTVLNQTKVVCWRLAFLTGNTRRDAGELSLVIMRFDRGERVQRELKVEAVAFEKPAADAPAEPPPPPAAGPEAKRLTEIVRAYAAGDRFMGSVLVAKGDTVLLSDSAGWADEMQKTANTADTRFRIGSLTKQFTAAAILLLQEQGKLSVDDSLARFVPDAPEAWRGITLRHLLTHTSGIPNFTSLPDYATWKAEPQTLAQLLERVRDRPLDFAPGEKFNYSNTGYVLLGWVVGLASGGDYATFLRDNVFLPLGMKDSGYEPDDPPIPPHARGFLPSASGPKPAGYINMQVPGGAGALYSTAPDLLRWTQGLFGGKVLSPASLELMTTPVKDGYAFGVGVSTVDGRKVISHAGAIDGFVSMLSYYPEEKLTVAVLANVMGAPLGELNRQLTEVALGRSVTLQSERKETSLPAATLQRYVGVYQLTPVVTNTVRLVDGQLTTQLSGQRALPLFPESEKKFFLKAVDAQVEFVADEQGRVTHLLQFQNGRTQNAPRIGDVVERKAIAVAPEVLAAYVGRYELPPDAVFVIAIENGQLMIYAPRQRKSVLRAETETKFFSDTVDAQVEFIRDAQGAVTHLVVQVGGRQTRAERQP